MLLKTRRFILFLLGFLTYAFAKAQCPASLSIVPPSCTSPGGYILTIPNTSACTGVTPYLLTWITPSGCQSPTLTSVPGPGTYAVTYTSGCLSGYQVFITDDNGNGNLLGGAGHALGPSAPSTLSFTTLSSQQPACFGNCNGSRTVFWNSSAGPLTVTLTSPTGSGVSTSTWANVPAFSPVTYPALCAGVHSFAVTDANGCTFTTNLTFTVTQPSTLTATSATRQPSCNGGSDGSFSVMPTGGTAGYTVTFNNSTSMTVAANGTATANGYSASVASATVVDSRGCVATISANIGQPTSMTITSTQTNVTCGGACTGQASVTVTGGGGGYTYTWSPGPGNTASINAMCAGTHTVSITDANTCVRTRTITITQPTSITITPTITNVTCNNQCNGAASVTASGPPGPITFTWLAPPTGSVIGTGSVISSRCAGTYTLLASADPTCVTAFTVNITQPPAITLTALTQSVNCINLCNGSATASAAGGNGGTFTFTWTPASNPPPVQTGSVAVNLCAQNYTLSARDPSSCAASTVITIVQPPAFSFGITTTSINCNGQCTGIINASPSGGTSPYSYTLVSATGSISSNSPVFTNLCAGNYTLRVSDNSPNCAQSTTVNIAQPNPLVPSVSTTSISCFSVCSGGLSGSATGGTPGYTLSWNTPTGTVAGGVLTNRCAGSYTFNITDANGCNSTPTVVNLTQPPAVTVNIGVTNASCNGFCNGALSASVSGGTPGYTLTWSSGTGNPNVNRCAGNYSLTVTDARSCTTIATASVGAPPAIALTQSITPPTCANSCNGSATISAAGGVGSFTFQFNTSPVITNTTGILSGRCAGNFIVNVTDGNNCSQPLSFSINNPVALSAAITGTRNSCTSCTGAGTVTASNGQAPYTFAWTNSVNATVGTTSAVASLCPGNYTASVTDNLGCTATATTSIAQIVIISAVNGGTGIQCFGACTASAVASAAGGTAPYNFTWSPTAQNTATATNLCAGQYTVTISDSNNPACVSTATINVTQPPDITITSTQTNVTCFNTCDGAIRLNASGGTGALTYSWSPGSQTSSSITGLCAGTYTARVTDANGCTKPPLTFNITPPFPPITATVNATNPTNCGSPNNGSICITAGGGNGTYSYTWSPAVAGNTTCATGLVPGTYSVIIGSGACTNTFFTNLSAPNGPSLTLVSSQSVSCFSGTNGSVTYSASGVGPFTFTWTPAAFSTTTTATTSGLSGLPSGTYVLASTDIGNNCITTQSIAILQPSSITVNGTAFNVRCNGTACDGSITIAPSGGNGGYTYSWSPTNSTSQNQVNVCAGTYTVRVSDVNGCTRTSTFAITVPPVITITSTLANVRCNSACNGSIAANATGGTGAISYSWLPVGAFTGSSTATVLNLCPNTYTLLASDANSCSATSSFTITEPPALTSSVSFQNATCFNQCNGSATLTASGGVPTYSFSWSSGGATTAAVASLCPGNYTGNVTDANGCVSSQGFTLAAPPAFSAALVPSHPLCNGACNGSVSTSLSGAQGAVSFTWLPVGSGQNPQSLCASTYTMMATDANSCQTSAVVTLTNPPSMLANVTTTSAACDASCDGAALATPVNAVGAVNYTWLPSGPNAPSNSGLCAGSYTVTLRDANSCTVTQAFNISAPPQLTINPSVGPATCGNNNGSITAVPVGGTPGYTFAWSSPSITTTGSVATNLYAGIYTVTVTDSKSCTSTVNIFLSDANGPTAPVTSTNVFCNGACTGAASVGVISGGAPPFATPVWVQPTPTVSGSFITGLCANQYVVELTDNNNCKTFTGTTITEPPPVSIQANISLPVCNGICNGTITVNTAGGVAPYTYSWMPGVSSSSVLLNACAGINTVLIGYNSGSCVSTQTVNVPAQQSISIAPPVVTNNICFGDCQGSATVNVLSSPGGSPSLSWSNGQFGNTAFNLCNGNYSVLVTDAQGCNNTFTVPVTSPARLSISAIVDQPECGRCNGEATVTASGGTGSTYTYNWTSGASGPVAGNLCAGLYQVQVTDSLNCRGTDNVIINNSSGITGDTVSVVNETCPGDCNGSATVTALGGTAPITYSWTNLSPANTGTTATNLCGNTYFVQMTDAEGCVRTTSLTVVTAAAFTISPFVTPPACNATNGTVNVVVSGGTPAYTFSWTPAAPNSSVLSNVGAGSYTVVVTDQNGAGCPGTEVVTVSNPNGPVLSVSQKNQDCASVCDGSISVTSTTTPAPTYTWSNGSNNASLTGLCEGVLTLTATSNGCSTVRSFTITGNPSLLINSVAENITCNGLCNGAVNLLPVGGSLPYTFSWSPAVSAGSRADSLCAGGYSATVTDARGCLVTASASLTEGSEIAVTATVTNSSCGAVPDGSASMGISGGVPSYTLAWSGPGNFTFTGQTATNLMAGTYTLNLTDSLGCERDTTVQIIPTITLTANAGPDFTVCPGVPVVLDGSASQGAISYSWSLVPEGTPVGSAPTLTIGTPLQTQVFQLTVLSTNSLCTDTDEVMLNVFAVPYLDAGPSFTIPVFSTVVIGGNPTTTGNETFTWSPAFSLDDPFAQNPVASNTLDVTYTVTVTYGNGCEVSDTMQVLLYPEILVTSGFSPNGDGKNDRWIIDYIDQFPDNTVEIYNRWGELLFFSRGYETPFDGTYKGKNLPVGTYYYVIKLNHPAYTRPYTGPLTIFR